MAFVWNHFSVIHLLIDGTLVALVFAALLVFARRLNLDRGSSLWRVLSALLLAAVAVVIPIAILTLGIGFPGSVFLFARVLWIVPTVCVPLAAVVLLVRGGRRRSWLWLLVVLPLVLKIHGEVIEPRRLEVERITLEMEELQSELRVVHLSDLQTDGIDAMQLAARQAANSFDAHLLLFTGDVLNHADLLPAVSDYLLGFEREHAFFVSGNVDRGLDVARLCRDSGMTLLDGRSEVVVVEGSEVAMLGLGARQGSSHGVLVNLVKETPGVRPRLLLSHFPDTLRMARNPPIDLLLAGHTHGGQIVIPGFGPPVTFTSVDREIAAGGLHRVGELNVSVSRGLGWEGHYAPRVRLFCRPHLILLTLVPPAAG